jgi:PD-(D/E)XK nuclease superfamily
MLGFYVDCEVNTANGRADAVVTLPDRVYIFEFKINGSADAALKQIKNRDYAGKYAASGKKIVPVGVGLSKTKKGITGIKVGLDD